ncbi:MAG: DNA translocase FtsK 4TM domain-containing protein [Anaerolineales bacterium]|nr:DNA translocase FtsK 4TM domain-containing protein [Anaerolineales bacterium]
MDEWLVRVAAPWQYEILGLSLVLLGAITFLSLTDLPLGSLATNYRLLLRRIFGWGSWIIAVSLAFAGLHVALNKIERPWRLKTIQVIGFEILFAASLALTHLTSAADEDKALAWASTGRGGGYVGWALSFPLVDGVGLVLAWILLTSMWLLGLGLILQISRYDVQNWLERLSAFIQNWAESIQTIEEEKTEALKLEPAPAKPRPQPTLVQKPLPQPVRAQTQPHELIVSRPKINQQNLSNRPSYLPPLDLLEPGLVVEQDEEEIKKKAAIIENTLLEFGLPVQVVEVRRGPSVTQFGIAPQYIEKSGANGAIREQKVRVSQITALSKDLALALAATHIRIEAPVPGRPIVGIEVPNKHGSMVHLRPVLESEQYFKIKSPLTIALGLNVSGAPIAADLAKMPHLLIAGTTGSGKSVCINSITTSLVCNNSPDELKLVMVDPKMVELVRFNGLPHLLGKVEVDLERIIGLLRWMTHEMDERYKVLAEHGVRNVLEYNKRARRRKTMEQLPYIVLIIDELADLMMMAPEEVEQTLVRLAQMARAVGIHLMIATQRPSTDVVTGLIKANFPARIGFAVASSIDSRVILDHTGAESLLGKGDMLYQASDSPKPVRLQGCFVSDLEIERIVSFWRDQETEINGNDKTAPWEEFLIRESVIQEKDPLLEDAIALAQENETLSTSVIQRRLRVGFPRAARLMDALEEMGVVGSGRSGGRSRNVLVDEDDDPLGDYARDVTSEG